MEKIKGETTAQYLERLSRVAATLTQEQVDACAYVMGGSGCGWTPNNITVEIANWANKYQTNPN